MKDRSKGYFAAVLLSAGSEALSSNSVHSNVFCHHVTLAYRPDPETAEKYEGLIGEFVELRAVWMRTDEKGQAAIVSGIESENKHPHVTISCADGVEPVYSNELLAARKGKRTPLNIRLFAEVQFIPIEE
ncbi:hypothetical protein N9L18_00270 [Candidatus Pacebacteria bacterium]|nr:hypothetical protein [Candidatus Paceibacterota bacterium]